MKHAIPRRSAPVGPPRRCSVSPFEVAVGYTPRAITKRVARAFAERPELAGDWQTMADALSDLYRPSVAYVNGVEYVEQIDPAHTYLAGRSITSLVGFTRMPYPWTAKATAVFVVSVALATWADLHGPEFLREQGIDDPEIERSFGRLPGAERSPTLPPSLGDAIEWLRSGELLAWRDKVMETGDREPPTSRPVSSHKPKLFPREEHYAAA